MKELVIAFEDDEIEMLQEQLDAIQDAGMMMETLEDYVYYATMSHCKTMRAASSIMQQAGGLDQLLTQADNVHIGVLNMPVQLENVEDKEEFSEFLNEALNNAVKDFNNRNNGPLN